MEALVCERFGAAPVVRERDVGEPGRGQVRVRQAYSGVGAGDLLMAAGRPWLFRPVFAALLGRSGVLGREVAGVVEAVGDGVTGISVGDRVIGEVANAWAEQVLVDAGALAVVPEGVSLRDAGGLAVSAITALQGLRAGGVRPGASVLVVGASGAVGHFAVQLAADLGASVTGVCSAAKAESVRALGAERVLDYRKERYTDAIGAYDVVLDLAGDQPLGACLATLAPGGTYVSSAGSNGGWLLGPLPRLLLCAVRGLVDRRVVMLTTSPDPADLKELLTLVEQGRLKPGVTEELAPHDVAPSLSRLGTGSRAGKPLVRFAGAPG